MYVESKKEYYKGTYLQNRKKHTDLENEHLVATGEGWREGRIRELEMDMDTLLYLKWVTRTSCTAMELRSMLCGSLDRREFGGE